MESERFFRIRTAVDRIDLEIVRIQSANVGAVTSGRRTDQ